AAHVGGVADGDLDRPISGVNSPAAAGPHDVVFIVSARHAADLAGSAAGAVILPRGVDRPARMAGIAVAEPALAMISAVERLVPRRRTFDGVSPLAFVGEGAAIGAGAGVGPFVFIGDRVRIGRGTEIHPGATIGADAAIGDDCVIYSGVHI